MAPGGGGKRKRGDRTFSQDGGHDGSRPSPHRPGNLSLAQQSNTAHAQSQPGYGRDQQEQRGGGRRRASRGGRGTGSQRSPINSPNALPLAARTSISGKAQSPPSTPTPTRNDPEHATLPLSAPSTNTATTQTSDPQQPPAPLYFYECVTDERMSQWDQGGRINIVDIGVTSRRDEDCLVLGSLFQELLKSGVDGRMDAAEAGNTIKTILEADSDQDPIADTGRSFRSFDASSFFLDCLSIIAETSTVGPRWPTLLIATGISPLAMRHQLEAPLLESLGLIRSTFVRMGIRQQTNLLYRQSNYNLLREETEGYSKLITELFTTSSTEGSSNGVTEDTFERVKGMIGAFDLDVGRVLDVTLDVFAAVLVKHYRFFVKYLRASSWWPQGSNSKTATQCSVFDSLPSWALPSGLTQSSSGNEDEDFSAARDERDRVFWLRAKQKGMAAFFELGDRAADDNELQAAVSNVSGGDPADLDEDKRWIQTTGTLPPQGNRVAAQILGFKLRFYSSSARSPTDILPVNLIYLAALLIKIGFISLRDLYPHLWPADEAMAAVKEEKLKEKAEKELLNRPGVGTMNALTSAGALPDDMAPSFRSREPDRLREIEGSRNSPARTDPVAEKSGSTARSEEKEELPEPSDQKVQLLKSLLCIGAIPEALYVLGRFPWIPDAFPELPEYIHRIAHHSLQKVYEPLRPLREDGDLKEQRKEPDSDQTGVSKGHLKVTDGPPRKVLRWAQLDKEDTNEAVDYRFYWDHWADNVPICQSIDDVVTLCSTLLNYSGVKIGQDPGLLLKITRIATSSLAIDDSEANRARWIDLSKRLLVPALSITKRLPGVVHEVFELIKHFPTMTRYSIYAEWYQGPTSRLPEMRSAFEQTRAETKDVLKRISKTNTKPMGRALAHVAHGSPGVVFEVTIAQIESYDNLVDTVVECARSFTFLSYDVFTWSILRALGSAGRVRVQQDGMLTSRWLSSLSLFIGKVFRRYSHHMSPTPVLEYVAEQLHQSNPTDLIVLEQITSSMAGIVTDTNFNEAQVLAMAGGELLQAQTMLQLLDKRHESKTSAKRLLQALTAPRLAGQLLVLIAQERQTCVFKIPERNAHLKLLGNLFDELHRVFVQYLDLLRTNLPVQEFDDLVPSVSRLIIEFGVDPNIAFTIARPSITAAMAAHDLTVPKASPELKKPTVQEQAGEVTKPSPLPTNSEDKAERDVVTSQVASAVPVADQVNGTDTTEAMNVDAAQTVSSGPTTLLAENSCPTKQPWHPVLRDIMDQLAPALPTETWEVLSRPFFVTFWSLSLGDMFVPSTSYDEELNRKKKRITEINNDRTSISREATQTKEKEKRGLTDLQDRLRAEFKSQIQAYSTTRTRLSEEKDQWFAGLALKKTALNGALLEQCFLPRILLSPIDAMFSFRMFKFLHSSGASNFWSMGFLDQIFGEKRLTSILFLCTAKEAEYLGRFLNEVLRELSRWHADKAAFEKEAYGPKKDLPGFVHKQENETLGFLPYEGFRSLLFKWHRQLHIALKGCFAGGEYMHIRNAINVQKAVYQTFPAIDWMGVQLVKTITELSKNETREDLKLAAMSLLGNLKRREKEWVLQNAFGAITGKANGLNGHRAGSAKPSTPQAQGGSGVKDPNPKAAEFQPNGRLSTDGATDSTARKASKTRTDAEDGEIEDAKMTDATMEAHKPTADVVKTADGEEASVSRSAPSTNPSVTDPPLNAPPPSQTPKPAMAEPSRNPTPGAVEQPKPQAHDLKSNTPADKANSPSIPPRPEVPRSSSAATVNGRPQHGLPSRPDTTHSRIGESRMPDGGRNHRDHARDQRYPPRGGLDGTRDITNERATERLNPPPEQRSYERVDRLPNGERERPSAGGAGEKGPPGRLNAADWKSGLLQNHESRPPHRPDRIDGSLRDRPAGEMSSNLRAFDSQGPLTRDGTMGPPRSIIPHHPDRAALIHGNTDRDRLPSNSQHQDRRQEPRRYDGPLTSERASRPGSPSRLDDRRNQRFELGREDRPPFDSRQAPENIPNGRLSRYDDNRLPTGPRTDRPVLGSQGSPQDRFRESPRHVSNPSPGNEQYRRDQSVNHGSRQQESQYGRLNAGPEIPSGPRLPNGNSAPPTRGIGRNVSAPHQINTQQTHSHPAPSNEVIAPQEKQTPTGPSSRGLPRNAPPVPRPEAASSAPPTPVADSPDTAGVHPDRLRAIQGGTGAPPVTATQGPMGRSPRDPMPAISVPPAPGQRQSNQLPSPGGPLPSPGPPIPGSIGPSPTSRGPPTGPSLGNDRARGDKRMFAGLQNTLQQAGTSNGPERSGQGTSIRGRGGRANNPPIPSPTASDPPTSASHAPPPEAFPRGGDLFANRPPPPPAQQNREADQEHARVARRAGGGEPFREPPRDSRDVAREDARGRNAAREEGHNEERRSGHHRSSRDHSRDNGPAPPHPSRDDNRPARRNDPRDRGRPPMPPPIERDMRRPPRMDDQRRAESDRRDMESWDREGRNGMERRDDRDRRDGGGSGRKRGRGSDDGHNDSKRPRRQG